MRKEEGSTYLSNFVSEGVCFITVLHEHLILSVCLMLVIQLDDIIVIHLLVNATLALCIHPVVLCQQFILADDLLDHVQVSLLILHQGHHLSLIHI